MTSLRLDLSSKGVSVYLHDLVLCNIPLDLKIFSRVISLSSKHIVLGGSLGTISFNIDDNILVSYIHLVSGQYDDPPFELAIENYSPLRGIGYEICCEDPEYISALLYYNPLVAKLEELPEKPKEIKQYPPRELEWYSKVMFSPWAYPIFGSLDDLPDDIPYLAFLGRHENFYSGLLSAYGYGYVTLITKRNSSFYSSPYSFMKVNSGGIVPLLLLGVSDNPYDLFESIVEKHRNSFGYPRRLRKEKGLDEIFRKIGWCSWNAFQKNVNHDNIIHTIRRLNQYLPIKWVLIDDGWQDVRDNALDSFHEDKLKFPYGLKRTVEELEKIGIENVGVWITLQGYWFGVHSNFIKEFSEGMFIKSPYYENRFIPNPINSTAFKFYREYFERLFENNISFLKIDNQKDIPPYFVNIIKLGNASTSLLECIQGAAALYNMPIISCMSLTPYCMYNWSYSTVARGGPDYVPYWREGAKRHLIIYGFNNLWLHAFSYPDWDMVMSSDPYCLVHIIGRAINGGPFYLTDRFDSFRPEVIYPLINDNGELLVSSMPAFPSVDTIDSDPYNEKVPFKLFSKYYLDGFGDIGILGVFNLYKDDKEIEFNFTIDDVYGLDEYDEYMIYEYFTQELGIYRRDFSINGRLAPLGIRLFIVSPIRDGIGVIGVREKYISPSAVTHVHRDKSYILLNSRAEGTFLLYVKDKVRGVLHNGLKIPYVFENSILKFSASKGDILVQFR